MTDALGILQEDEQNLKKHIKALESSIKDMTEDAANSARLYVTDEDIAKLPCTANDTVFAVKAPQGTTLEVPDPDDGLETGQRRYRYLLHVQPLVYFDLVSASPSICMHSSLHLPVYTCMYPCILCRLQNNLYLPV